MNNKFDDTPIRLGVKQVLRSLHLEAKEIILLSGERTNILYEVNTPKSTYMVRVEPKNQNRSDITLQIMKDLSTRAIIPNKFIIIDSSRKYLNRNILITEKIAGNEFLSEINKGTLTKKDIKVILRAAITNCLKISNRKTVGFGRIEKNFTAPAKSEKAYIFKSLDRFLSNDQILEHLGNDILTQIRAFFEKNRDLFNLKTPKLVYVDFHLRNIIIQDRKFKSLIDFDYFISGDPLVMFAHLAFRLMENEPSIKEIFKNLLAENGITPTKKLKLRLFTIWMALVSLFFMIRGEIEGPIIKIKNYQDLSLKNKILLLLDENYQFF